MTTTDKRPERRLNAPLHIETVNVNGMQLRVATRPSATGRPPLMLLNGIGAKLEAFNSFIDALNPEMGIITFDAPGVGGSPRPSKPFRMRDLAMTMAALLEHFGHAHADVFGISWGGALAQEFAYVCPNHCRRLILASTSASSLTIPRETKAMMNMMNPMRFMQKDFVANNMGMYGGKLRLDPKAAGNMDGHMAAGMDSAGEVMFQMMALMGWTSLHWLHKIKQPTLVMHGKDDPIVSPTNAQTIANRIPNARLELVDCGHLFIFTCADEVAAMVDDFLGVPGQPA
jgi:poly(3-hydroxyalkanoate) depolymerase